jgi:hypothetical protein
MKKIYISPVCEGFLTEQEEILAGSVIVTSGADDYDPFAGGGDNPPVEEGEIGSGDFAKGGMVWDNTIFD